MKDSIYILNKKQEIPRHVSREAGILELLDRGVDMDRLITESRDYGVFLHFSKIRHNILTLIPENPGGRVLEIGADCGALTGYFCDRFGEVTALEPRGEKAAVLKKRHGERPNLTIVEADLASWGQGLEAAFDCIALVGPWDEEVLGTGGEADSGSVAGGLSGALRACKSLLVPEGVLLIAADNKYSLRGHERLLGACGMAGEVSDNPEATGSRPTPEGSSLPVITAALARAGFTWELYYPYPDHRFTEQIFTDERLPAAEDLRPQAPAYDSPGTFSPDEAKILAEAAQNGEFSLVAPSFLLICR